VVPARDGLAATRFRLMRRPKGILAGPVDGPERLAAAYPTIEGAEGLGVLHRASGFVGSVSDCTTAEVTLVGTTGLHKTFPNCPGAFAVDGRPARLVPSRAATVVDTPDLRGGALVDAHTASGSRAVRGARARVARAGRILVEGVHDAMLLEHVWGDDLRLEGVVVDRLDGIDDVELALRALQPGPGRRVGVLVDHLLPGSKEQRIADRIADPHVLVRGTPYVDVWQAVRPKTIGIEAWPVIPKGEPWKDGVCAALGMRDPRELWRRILQSVESWNDLEQTLVASVESLIDFVTADSA
jgi:Protein of unknown function (DUF3097)